MNLHEYQAKELLGQFDLPILNSKVYFKDIEKIENDIDELNGPPWAVKSQIHAGGRGAGYFKNSFNGKGGVQIAKDKKEVLEISQSMFENILVTKQTGKEGKKVSRIFIEQGCTILKEFYLSVLIDRSKSKPMMIISSEGGIDIEEIALKSPEKIEKILLSMLDEFELPANLKSKLSLTENQYEKFVNICINLVKAFKSLDATSIEINPLVLDNNNEFFLLDSKISIDDNALFRHPEIEKLKDISEENPFELEATRNQMNYVKLNGSIGCIVNGAGLAMATMDIIKNFGEEPANFLDLGGTANKDRVVKAFKIIQSDEKVKSVLINIFGGIVRCDIIATGIVEAIKELNFKLPLVIRFQGTNASKGRDIINESSLNIFSIEDFSEAAKKVVDLIKK